MHRHFSPVLAIALGIPLLGTCLAEEEETHPLQDKDRCGIEWVFPFTKALKRARDERRMLMIVPITFKTTCNGDW